MQGADIAFYTGRSRYHTMDDSIRGMGDGGAQKSLWSLLELLHSVSNSILNSTSDHVVNDEKERAVYFERRSFLIIGSHCLCVFASIWRLPCSLPLPRVAGHRDSSPCFGSYPPRVSRIPPRFSVSSLTSNAMGFTLSRIRAILVSTCSRWLCPSWLGHRVSQTESQCL